MKKISKMKKIPRLKMTSNENYRKNKDDFKNENYSKYEDILKSNWLGFVPRLSRGLLK